MVGQPETPVILIAHTEDSTRERIAAELQRRYGSDYEIVVRHSAPEAVPYIDQLLEQGRQLALVLADQSALDETGALLFGTARRAFADCRRGLLVEWGAWADSAISESILRLIALGQIHYYVLVPSHSPDEYFHRTITEFLLEWERSSSGRPQAVTLVADRWSRQGHELRSLLARNGIPHVYLQSDSPQGAQFLSEHGLQPGDGPVVELYGSRILVNPSKSELFKAYGVRTELNSDTDFDVAVIGAGPAGLAAAVYASSEGLSTLVVERESIGGQAGSSSLIRNYLGFSRGITGAELAQRAYQQAWVFGTTFLLTREVAGLSRQGGYGEPEGRFTITLAEGTKATARAVVLATGVSYRRVEIPDLEALNGAGVFYGASVSEARAMAGEEVYVLGGGNSAGQAALHLARYAQRVTILVRSTSLAESMSQYLIDEIVAAGIDVKFQTEVVDGGGQGRLEWLELKDRESGTTTRVPAAALFILIGAMPRTEWLPEAVQRDQWGYVFTGADAAASLRWPLDRPPMMFETCVPGIFAVGDVRRGSVKRVASAVGEGSVAISQVHSYLGAPLGAPAPARERSAREGVPREGVPREGVPREGVPRERAPSDEARPASVPPETPRPQAAGTAT